MAAVAEWRSTGQAPSASSGDIDLEGIGGRTRGSSGVIIEREYIKGTGKAPAPDPAMWTNPFVGSPDGKALAGSAKEARNVLNNDFSVETEGSTGKIESSLAEGMLDEEREHEEFLKAVMAWR